MKFSVPANLQDRMPAGSLMAIEKALRDQDYSRLGDDFRAQLGDYLALCVIDDKNLTGKFLTSVYAHDPGLFTRLGEHKKMHDTLIVRLQNGKAPRP